MKETSIWDNLINRYSFNFLGIYFAETIILMIIFYPINLLIYLSNNVPTETNRLSMLQLIHAIDFIECIFNGINIYIPIFCLIISLFIFVVARIILLLKKILKFDTNSTNYILGYFVAFFISSIVLISIFAYDMLYLYKGDGAIGIYTAMILYPLTLLTLITIPTILFLLEFNKNFRIKNKFIIQNKAYAKTIGSSLYISIIALVIALLTF